MNPERLTADNFSGPVPVSTVQAGSIRIAYAELGAGEPFLLIMGLGGTMHEWDRTFLTLLAPRHHLIIFDNRGIGDSEEGNIPLTIPGMTEDLYHLFRALELTKAHLFGYSMGATVALVFAEKYPDLVGNLILYAPCVDGGEVVRMIHRYLDPALPELIRIQAILPDDFLS